MTKYEPKFFEGEKEELLEACHEVSKKIEFLKKIFDNEFKAIVTKSLVLSGEKNLSDYKSANEKCIFIKQLINDIVQKGSEYKKEVVNIKS